MKYFVVVLFAIAAEATVAQAANRSCTLKANGGTCDRIVTPTVNDVGAGEVVCIRGGTYDTSGSGFYFADFNGTATDPILVTPCEQDGNAVVQFNKRVQLTAFSHVIFSGAIEGATYGFRIDGNAASGYALGITGSSTDVEVERFEIYDSAFAGIMFKTDGLAATSAPQANTHLHHNYIHDVIGEGLYIGNSFYSNDQQQRLVGTRIHHNIVIHTGTEGIQLGCADEDTEVNANYVENAGAWEDWQTTCPVASDTGCFDQSNGVQLGQGTQALFFDNVIVKSRAHGLIFMGWGGTSIFNNVIVDAGHFAEGTTADGLWYSPRSWTRPVDQAPTGDRTYGVVAHNTFVDIGKYGYEIHSSTATATHYFVNNLVAKADEGAATKHISKTWTLEGYSHLDTIEAAGFVNALTYEALQDVPVSERWQSVMDAYGLASITAPAFDAGITMTASYAVGPDPLAVARPACAAPDAGARERSDCDDVADPDGGDTSDGGELPDSDAPSDNDNDAGSGGGDTIIAVDDDSRDDPSAEADMDGAAVGNCTNAGVSVYAALLLGVWLCQRRRA